MVRSLVGHRATPLSVSTLDAHAGGGAVRLVTGGIQAPRGRSAAARRASLDRIAAPWRDALLREPRGHPDTTLAVLAEPTAAAAHAAVLFLRRGSSPPFSGHGLMAVAALASSRGLVTAGTGPAAPLVFETVAGVFAVSVGEATATAARRVRLVAGQAWVIAGGLETVLGTRRVRADVVCCEGCPMALVDAESAGVGLGEGPHPVLRRVARDLAGVVSAALPPAVRAAERTRIGGVVFTGLDDTGEADLRTCTVWADGAIDRSPSVRAAAGLLALFDELGLVPEGRALLLRGPAGGTFEVRLAGRDATGAAGRAVRAVRAEVSGTVWPTGDHLFAIDPSDVVSGLTR
jgi:proline racemase